MIRADHRHQDDQRPPGARRREQVGIVMHRELVEEQEVVDEADEVAEDHRAEAGDEADDDGEKREIDEPDRMDVVGGRLGSVSLRSSARKRGEFARRDGRATESGWANVPSHLSGGAGRSIAKRGIAGRFD